MIRKRSVGESVGLLAPFSVEGKPFGVMLMPNGTAKSGFAVPVGSTATTITPIGNLSSPSVQGTPSAQPQLSGATRMYVQWVSGSVSGNAAGLVANGSGWRANVKPLMGCTFRWPGETNLRLWVGLGESTMIAQALAASGTSSIDFACIGFETGVSTKFMGATCDGTNMSAVDLAGNGAETPVANHEYLAIVDPRTESGTACTFYLWDLTAGTFATLRKTTHVLRVVNTVNLQVQASITTTEAAAKSMQVADFFAVSN